MIQKESYWRDAGDHGHGKFASISRLDASSLLTEGRECWEEAGEEEMGGGLWENRVQSVPPGNTLFSEVCRRGGTASSLWGFGGTHLVGTLTHWGLPEAK